MSEALDELKAWADRLGKFLPGMGGPSSEDISRMSPDEYAQYRETLQGAQTRAQPKVRRLVGNVAKSVQSVDPDTGEVKFFASDPTKMTRPEIADELIAMPAWLGEALGYDMSNWPQSQQAMKNTEAVEGAMREGLDYPPPSNTEEYALEAAGSMLGQLPVPEGSFAKLKAPFRAAGEAARKALGPVAGRAAQATTLAPRAGIEFFSPMVEPSLQNYGMGTGFGTGLSYLRDPNQDEFDALQWKLQHGEIDPDEAVDRLNDLLTRAAPQGHAKGGKITIPPIKLFRGVIGSVKEGIPQAALEGKPRPEYGASFFSTDPHVAASYGTPVAPFDNNVAGAVVPVHVHPEEIIDFPVDEDGGFNKFEFDRWAQRLKPGQVLRAKQVYDYGPRADPTHDPDKKYSYRSDVYAVGPDTKVTSALGQGKYAKGGKIKPPSLMELRKSIEGMLRETPELTGSGKEMVPVTPDPTADVPAPTDITPTLDDLKQMAGEAAPAPSTPGPTQIMDMPISRRTFLKGAARGAASLMNPIDLNLGSLLDPVTSSLDLGKLGATAMENFPFGSIARLNDGEGYERTAWGGSVPEARRNLVNQLAEGMDTHDAEFEDLDQIHGTLKEFGLTHTRGTIKDFKDWKDPWENVMAVVRGGGWTGDEDMPHALARQLEDPEAGPHTMHDVEFTRRTMEKYAEEQGIPYEEVKDRVVKQAIHEAANNQWFQGAHLDASMEDYTPGTLRALEEIKQKGMPELQSDYSPDDLWGVYPELKPGEVLDLHDLLQDAGFPSGHKPWTIAPKLNHIWSNVVEESDGPFLDEASKTAQKIPDSGALQTAIGKIRVLLQGETEYGAGYDSRMSAAVSHFENELDKLAHKHGVIMEAPNGQPMYSSPGDFFQYHNRGLEKYAESGSPEDFKAALSWHFDPETYHELSTPENIQSFLDFVRKGHPIPNNDAEFLAREAERERNLGDHPKNYLPPELFNLKRIHSQATAEWMANGDVTALTDKAIESEKKRLVEAGLDPNEVESYVEDWADSAMRKYDAAPEPLSTTNVLQSSWENLLEGSEDFPERVGAILSSIEGKKGFGSLETILNHALKLESSDESQAPGRSKAFKSYEKAWKDLRANAEKEILGIAKDQGLTVVGGQKLDLDEPSTIFTKLDPNNPDAFFKDLQNNSYDRPSAIMEYLDQIGRKDLLKSLDFDDISMYGPTKKEAEIMKKIFEDPGKIPPTLLTKGKWDT